MTKHALRHCLLVAVLVLPLIVAGPVSGRAGPAPSVAGPAGAKQLAGPPGDVLAGTMRLHSHQSSV